MSLVTLPIYTAIDTRIVQLLEGINPAETDPNTDAPYTQDLRGKCFVGRRTFGESDKLPILSLMDATPSGSPDKVAGVNGHKRIESRTLFLQGVVGKNTVNPLNPLQPAQELVAMIVQRLSRIIAVDASRGDKVLYPADYMLGDRLLADFSIGLPSIRMDENVAPTASFYMLLEVDVAVDVTKPYATITVP